MNMPMPNFTRHTATRLSRRLVGGSDWQSLLVLSAVITGCGVQGLPQLPPGPPPPVTTPPFPTQTSPFLKGSYIFSLSSSPIPGFTFTNTGATLEHWTLRPPLQVGRAVIAGATLNDRIYAIGGQTLAGEVATVEMLDLPGTGVWSQVAPLALPRTGVAAAAANGKIYAIGGFRTGVPIVGTNEEYDPVANVWTPRATNPTPRSYATAVTVNGKVYLMGGSVIVNNLFTDSTSVDEYDPATDIWTPKAPMPVGLSGHAAAELNGKIHVLSGNVHQEYDPVANTWTPRAAMTVSRDRLGAFGWNGKLYAVGGRAGVQSISDVVEEYTPEFNGWEKRKPMSIPHHSFGYASIGPSFYRLGGIEPGGQPGNFQDNVAIEYFAHTNVFPFRKD